MTTRTQELRTFLVKLKLKRTQQDRINRYNKSHRSQEQQEIHDTRIIHITAKRFGLSQGQQFPLEAIILMADKGVVQAKKQYHKLAQAAEQWNISVREAYNHFVLGKELHAFNSHVKEPTNTESYIAQSDTAQKLMNKNLKFAKAYGAKNVTT